MQIFKFGCNRFLSESSFGPIELIYLIVYFIVQSCINAWHSIHSSRTSSADILIEELDIATIKANRESMIQNQPTIHFLENMGKPF